VVSLRGWVGLMFAASLSSLALVQSGVAGPVCQSLVLMLGVFGTVFSGVVDVLELVGGSKGGSDWGGREEEGIVIGIGSCGIAGESLVELFLLQQSCQLLSTGLHHDAVVKVGGHFFECVGREVGWFGGKNGFGIDDCSSFSSEVRSAQRSM